MSVQTVKAYSQENVSLLKLEYRRGSSNDYIARFILASPIFFVARLSRSLKGLASAKLACCHVVVLKERTAKASGREAKHADTNAAKMKIKAFKRLFGCEGRGET
jgi:hypothetical protein